MALDIPDDDQHAVMVCHKPEHLPGEPVPGTGLRTCFQCGADVYFASSSSQVQANAEARGLIFVVACCCCAEMHTMTDIVQASGRGDISMHFEHTFKDGVCTVCGIRDDSPDDRLAREARAEFGRRASHTPMFSPKRTSNG